MADTFEENLGIRLIETGAYPSVWGAVLNSDGLNLLAKAVTAQSAINLTSTAYSIPAMAQGADSDARSFCLRFEGSPAGAVTVTVPASVKKKLYLIDNSCGQAITFTYGSGDTATVAVGEKRFLWCSGIGCYLPSASASDAATLGGITAAQFARRDTSNVFTGGRNSTPWINVSEQPVTTIDAALGNHQRLTLSGNRSIAAPTNPVDGMAMVLQIRQDATGGRTVSWDSVFVFENGLPPVLAVGANAIDLFLMYYDGTHGQWLVGHFSSIGSAATASAALTIEGNQQDVSLAALLGPVSTPLVLTITIARGTILSAGSTASFALDLANALPSGSTVNLINQGYILGRGGAGGNGNGTSVNGSGNHGWSTGCQSGRPGGGALRGPGLGITFNINNAAGYIWGGGGGGGGGAAVILSNGSDAAGGGGGGGAGGGAGGSGGSTLNDVRGGHGGEGGTGVAGTYGTGGGIATTNAGTAGNGGAGGDWGAAGAAGANAGSGNAGAGGAAGKAIELYSGSINDFSGSTAPNVKGAVS